MGTTEWLAGRTMEVTAFLADSVVVADGKLFVQGAGWNIIWAPTFPMQHDRVGVGILIRVPWTATNEMHTIELHLEDGDGQQLALSHPDADGPPVTKLGGQFSVGRPPTMPHGDDQIVPMAMNLNGLLFDHPDRYTFVVSVDGSAFARLPFRVAMAADNPAPPTS